MKQEFPSGPGVRDSVLSLLRAKTLVGELRSGEGSGRGRGVGKMN